MISVLITTYNEMQTIGRAIESLVGQLGPDDELIVISPAHDMALLVNEYGKKYKNTRYICDKGIGKPSAMNIGFKEARGDILVLTDGDVYVDKNALTHLLKPFADIRTGAVSGHPISINSRSNLFGYWSHLLTNAANKIRLIQNKNNKFLECSGYLYAVRTKLIQKIPEDALAEDALISHIVASKKYKIRYAPEAYVYVKFPKNYSDWLKQKTRSVGGYVQKYVKNSPFKMRSLSTEIILGSKMALKYPRNLMEIIWTALLFLARIHLWLKIFVKVHILKKSLSELWVRIESTK